MAEESGTTNRRGPVLGWVSVGIAASVFALIVGSIIGLQATFKLRTPTADGIDATAGGVSEWVFYVLVAIFSAGGIFAVAGLVRGEQRRWVHTLGVVLNLGAPVAALATIRLILG